MEDLDKLFAAVASGEREPPEDGIDRTRLLRRVRSHAASNDAELCLASIGVAVKAGGEDGIGMLASFAQVDIVEVREAALVAALEQGERGLAVIRTLAGDSDEGLAVESLRRLRRLVDSAVTQTVRRQLAHEAPAVRAAAAELLGHVAGGSLVPTLRRLADDPDPKVKKAAADAVERALGNLPRDKPDPWWDVEAVEVVILEVEGPIPLPETLPGETAALYRLLGAVEESGRETVVEALSKCNDLWHAAVSHQDPGGDPTIAVGICLAAVALHREEWVVPIRRRLADPNARVRTEVAHALAALGKGKASLVMGLVDLLTDKDAEVRYAGARALGAIGLSGGVGFLQRHAEDKDPKMREAVAEGLALLG